MVGTRGPEGGGKTEDKIKSQRPRSSSQATSSLREPSGSIQVIRGCNSSRKVHGCVQFSVIATAILGKVGCGSKKCGTMAVYDGAENGAAYTDSRARIYLQ